MTAPDQKLTGISKRLIRSAAEFSQLGKELRAITEELNQSNSSQFAVSLHDDLRQLEAKAFAAAVEAKTELAMRQTPEEPDSADWWKRED